MAKKPAKKVARKRAAPKPPAKAGKKPARGPAKKAPVRVKAPQAVRVPAGNLAAAVPLANAELRRQGNAALDRLHFDVLAGNLATEAAEPRRGLWGRLLDRLLGR